MTTAADRARIRREALDEALTALDRARSVMADDDIEQYGIQYGINIVRELFDDGTQAAPRDAEMAVLQARNAQLWALLSGQQHVVEEIDRLNSEIAHLKALGAEIADEPPVVIPDGYTAPLHVKTIRETIAESKDGESMTPDPLDAEIERLREQVLLREAELREVRRRRTERLNEAAAANQQMAEEIARLRAGIQAVLDGDYPQGPK